MKISGGAAPLCGSWGKHFSHLSIGLAGTAGGRQTHFIGRRNGYLLCTINARATSRLLLATLAVPTVFAIVLACCHASSFCGKTGLSSVMTALSFQ
jgi:hypothetical protein